jgi:tripartite-type tricarboxylate transporter receptor subunit TctC
MPVRIIRSLAAALTVGGALLAPCNAAPADDFYQGKTLEIVVASGVGDSYDTLSRLVARHIGRYLPGNPAVIVQNMPGAGGILAANQLYNLAPRDGTVIGMLDQSVYETQLFKVPGLKADVTKMNWIGRIISNNAALYGWHSAAVQKIEDAYTKELIVAASGSSSRLRWTILKKLLNLKLTLITGYKSSIDGLLAMERGEADAVSMPWTVFRVTHADLLRDGKVNVLLQTGLERAPDLPDVPRVVDLAHDDEQRQILELFSQAEKVGRSLTAPPDLPPQRVALLRSAFTAILRDPQFLTDAGQMQLELSPLPGDELQAIIEQSFAYSPTIVAKAEALIHSAEQDR